VRDWNNTLFDFKLYQMFNRQNYQLKTKSPHRKHVPVSIPDRGDRSALSAFSRILRKWPITIAKWFLNQRWDTNTQKTVIRDLLSGRNFASSVDQTSGPRARDDGPIALPTELCGRKLYHENDSFQETNSQQRSILQSFPWLFCARRGNWQHDMFF
jgi:hypothetical protein